MNEQSKKDHFFVDEDGYGDPCLWYGKGPDDFDGSPRLVVRKHVLDYEDVRLWPLVSTALVAFDGEVSE